MTNMRGKLRPRSIYGVLFILVVLLLISVIFGVSLGSTTTPPLTTVRVMLSHLPGLSSWFSAPEAALDVIIYKIRFPRVILAVFVGAALAVAGAALQGLLRNPLAEPYTIGVASGAAVGAALVIIVFKEGYLFGVASLPFAAFLGALLTGILVYQLAMVNGHLAVETLIERGVPEHRILFLNLIASPSGVAEFAERFPKLRVVTSFIDQGLDEKK